MRSVHVYLYPIYTLRLVRLKVYFSIGKTNSLHVEQYLALGL